MTENWIIFIVGGLWTMILAIIGALIGRVLINIDRNQKQLSEELKEMRKDHNSLSKDFYEMAGEHYVNHGGRRAGDKLATG